MKPDDPIIHLNYHYVMVSVVRRRTEPKFAGGRTARSESHFILSRSYRLTI
jgi:hypothetical protein